MKASDRNRVIWHSRRGMLELDLLLVPFATSCFDSLSTEQKLRFEEFLAFEDQDLFGWLMRRNSPQVEYETIIRLILENAGVQA